MNTKTIASRRKENELTDSNHYTGIEVLPIKGPIGAEVRCGDVRELDDARFGETRRAWGDHLILLFRDQTLTDAELLHFANRFGELEKGVAPSIVQKDHLDNDYVVVVSNVTKNGVAIGSLGDGEAIWHTDMSFNEIPPAGSFLYALEIPPTGGETGVANMYQALETMPADLRKRIEGLTIFNDGRYNSAGVLRRASTSATHPIIRTHPETGYDALYLGRRPHARINELQTDESEELLNTLWTHATQARFAWHHSWKVGDILLWDNRCAMHHRNAFDPGSNRIMHRVQTAGTRPVRETGKSGAHPRHLLS